MDKDERSTDSKVKTGIQNILGGLVLGSLPLVAVALISMWGAIGTLIVQHKQLARDDASMLRRMEEFDKFKLRGGRFTEGMGNDLRDEIRWVRNKVIDHHEKAGPLIRQIKDNSSEIERLRDNGNGHQR